MIKISVSLKPEYKNRLKEIADENSRTVSGQIEHWIRTYEKQ